jgi:hypothetical protein
VESQLDGLLVDSTLLPAATQKMLAQELEVQAQFCYAATVHGMQMFDISCCYGMAAYNGIFLNCCCYTMCSSCTTKMLCAATQQTQQRSI